MKPKKGDGSAPGQSRSETDQSDQQFDPHILDDAELISIGAFLQNWLRLELTIDVIFGLIFDLDPYKRMCLTSNMSVASKINALKAAANLVEAEHQRRANHELNTSLNQAKKLSQLRNDLSHNWISGQAAFIEGRLLTKTSARGNLKREFKFIDFKHIKNSAKKCLEVANKLQSAAHTYAIGYGRFELADISMLKSTKYDPKFLDESFHQILKGEASIKADG